MNMADGLNMNPRPGEPESSLVPGMSAPRAKQPPAARGAGPLALTIPAPLLMPDTSGPGPTPLQTPLQWSYDFTALGVARASFPGVIAADPVANAGTWLPALTFVTPGNLAIGYSNQAGRWQRNGDVVTVQFQLTTNLFTWTTAAGNMLVGTLPFPAVAGAIAIGPIYLQGMTKAGFTWVVCELSGTGQLRFVACGSAQAGSALQPADMPSGGVVVIRGSLTYQAVPL